MYYRYTFKKIRMKFTAFITNTPAAKVGLFTKRIYLESAANYFVAFQPNTVMIFLVVNNNVVVMFILTVMITKI